MAEIGERRERRRQRGWLAGAGMLIVVAVGLAVLLSSRLSNSDDQLASDMEQVMGAISKEAAATTEGFLLPAQMSSQFLGGFMEEQGGLEAAELRSLMENTLASNDDFDGVFVGYPNGDFVYVNRSGDRDDAAYRYKQIAAADEELAIDREVTVEWMTPTFDVVAAEVLFDDTYDPRARPWYELTFSQDAGIWTEPYVFFSSRLPGVTRTMPVRSGDGTIVAVIGIDVRIDQLSGFMTDRAASEGGATFIISDAGGIVAHPGLLEVISADGDIAEITEFGDARVEAGESVLGDVESESFLADVPSETGPVALSIRRLEGAPDWALVVSAPVDDFFSAARSEGQENLRLAIVATASLLALLVWGVAAMASRNARLKKTVLTDDLTGLANRPGINKALEERLSHPERHFSLAIFDLDEFKVVNDTRGHEAGDELLRFVADEAARNVGAEHVGRLGGDEFVVILDEGLGHGQPVLEILERLLRSISWSGEIGGSPLYSTASLGVSHFRPDDHKLPADLLREADIALYAAKGAGGNRVRVYDADLAEEVSRRQRRRHDLKQAVLNEEFFVGFQPECDLETGELVGVEALLRWAHPSRGAVPANEFIAELDSMALLPQLTNLVLRQAATFNAQWNTRNPDSAIRIHVNLHPQELMQENLLTDVQWSGLLTGGRLVVELMERTLVEPQPEILERVEALRALGVRVAIDDFGSRSAPLATLGNLPIDTLKLDRRIVADLDGGKTERRVATLIAELGHLFDLEVIGSGIETTTQRTRLSDIGCTTGQGHLFGPALSAREFMAAWGRSSHYAAA